MQQLRSMMNKHQIINKTNNMGWMGGSEPKTTVNLPGQNPSTKNKFKQ
jgi:hypothetical protein